MALEVEAALDFESELPELELSLPLAEVAVDSRTSVMEASDFPVDSLDVKVVEAAATL